MNVLEIKKWSIKQLAFSGIENPVLDSELIISFVLQLNRLELNLHANDDVSFQQRKLIEEAIIRRIKFEPIQYILGETEFYGRKIQVNNSVLIPRPETEFLVEKIIKENEVPYSILEIGTGSGCIAIALKKHFAGSKISATDISGSALETARQNAKINNTEIDFIQSDLFEIITGKFDIIVSNPPYIPQVEYDTLPKEILTFEPEVALLAKDDGLFFYKKILFEAEESLNNNGKIYFEIGHDQAQKIREIALDVGFNDIEIVKDLNGFNRIVRVAR